FTAIATSGKAQRGYCNQYVVKNPPHFAHRFEMLTPIAKVIKFRHKWRLSLSCLVYKTKMY
ncbi:MAG: hypothetical protein K2J82_05600, partial [Muribaculaceae bacterium]|nr:hypothetical protein [Muribaculaceae bacterium]